MSTSVIHLGIHLNLNGFKEWLLSGWVRTSKRRISLLHIRLLFNFNVLLQKFMNILLKIETFFLSSGVFFFFFHLKYLPIQHYLEKHFLSYHQKNEVWKYGFSLTYKVCSKISVANSSLKNVCWQQYDDLIPRNATLKHFHCRNVSTYVQFFYAWSRNMFLLAFLESEFHGIMAAVVLVLFMTKRYHITYVKLIWYSYDYFNLNSLNPE